MKFCTKVDYKHIRNYMGNIVYKLTVTIMVMVFVFEVMSDLT
jgi:hypothetical protein